MRETDLAMWLRQADCSIAEMADGTAVLLDLHHEVLLTLNVTGAFMVARLRAGDDEASIARQVTARYAVDAATAREDVAQFVADLARSITGA